VDMGGFTAAVMEGAVNNVQRRLFRAFVKAGGDLSEDDEVERFVRCVENNLLLLPPKIREAVELVWRDSTAMPYELLATKLRRQLGRPVTVVALQQRVSRGTRLLEDAVRSRPWNDPPTSRRGSGAGRTHT